MAERQRQVRTYTETERLGAMALAVSVGEAEAQRQLDIPQRTISSWLAKHGGLADVRLFLEEKGLVVLLDAKRAVAGEVVRRADTLPAEEIGLIVREMLKEFMAPAPQQAQAQQQGQSLTVNLFGDGHRPDADV